MSITFCCPEAPSRHERVPCDSPTLGLTCTAEERCGYCDDGMMDERVTECPEANFANANATDILRLLGLEPSGWGEIEVVAMPSLLQRCLVVLARESSRGHLIHDASESGGERKMTVNADGMPEIGTSCRVINCGNSDEQIVRRVTSVRDLIVWAHERNYKINWG